jgi:HAD superfamily hydrolase (TIGR01490 family)
MNIAFFDFDGTITRKDSLLDFLWKSSNPFIFIKNFIKLSPTLILYILKFLTNDIAKERIITIFYKNIPIDDFNRLAKDYSINKIPAIINIQAEKALNWHKSIGSKIVVVTASPENWIMPWCEKNGYDLIATKLHVKNGILTGKFLTPNCHGIEKVIRITDIFDLSKYSKIFAYGDSKGDKEMLQIADVRIYRWKKIK